MSKSKLSPSVVLSSAIAAMPFIAMGCSAPAKGPGAAHVAAPIDQRPPVNSGQSVDALVINNDGSVTPMMNPEVAALTQATSSYAAMQERQMELRRQAALANQQRRSPAPQIEPEPVREKPPTRVVDTPVQANTAVVDQHNAHLAYRPVVQPAANLTGDGTTVRMSSAHRGGTVGPIVSPAMTPGGVVDPVQVLTQTFSDRVGANPRDPASQLDLQIARYLNTGLNDNVGPGTPMTAELSALPDEDREMISAVVDGLTNFRAVYRNERNPLATQKAAPLLEMAERIRSRTDLAVGSIALCTAVRAYGNYDPIEPLKFRSGVANTAVFYCEVEGFQSLLDEQGRWTTKLSIELRLFTATDAGLQVWDAKSDAVTDVSRKRRRDFFINKKIVLPATLNPGRYILKATVKDLQQKRVAEQHVEITLEGR